MLKKMKWRKFAILWLPIILMALVVLAIGNNIGDKLAWLGTLVTVVFAAVCVGEFIFWKYVQSRLYDYYGLEIIEYVLEHDDLTIAEIAKGVKCSEEEVKKHLVLYGAFTCINKKHTLGTILHFKGKELVGVKSIKSDLDLETAKKEGIKFERSDLVEMKLRQMEFTVDKKIVTLSKGKRNYQAVYVDSECEQFAYTPTFETPDVQVYNFEDLINYEVYEDGHSIIAGKRGSALLGGILLGTTGAVIGAAGSARQKEICQSMKMIIRMNSIQKPSIEIPFIKYATEKGSNSYKEAQNNIRELCSIIEYIVNHNDVSKQEVPKQVVIVGNEAEKGDVKDTLDKLKELFDNGYITEEEYLKKRADVLEKL